MIYQSRGEKDILPTVEERRIRVDTLTTFTFPRSYGDVNVGHFFAIHWNHETKGHNKKLDM